MEKGIKIIYDKSIGIYDENRNERDGDKTFAEQINSKNENCLMIDENSGKEYYKMLETNLNNYFNSDSLSLEELCK